MTATDAPSGAPPDPRNSTRTRASPADRPAGRRGRRPVRRRRPAPPGAPGAVALPWIVWIAAFAATEVFVVHVQLQRDSHSFSLTDLVFVAGLYLISPTALVAAQVAGAGLALVLHRRQFGLKLAFNLAQYALAGGLAATVFTTLGQGLTGQWTWVAALAAVAVANIVGCLCIFGVMRLSGAPLGLAELPRMIGLALPFALGVAAVGLLAGDIATHSPASLGLLALPSVLLIAAYRAYTRAREQQNNLRLLHEITSLLYNSEDAQTALTDFLDRRARRLPGRGRPSSSSSGRATQPRR